MSLQRLPLDPQKLNAFIRKARHYNIFPIYLPRYMAEGQKHPIKEQLTGLVEETCEYLSACTEREIECLLDHMPSGYRMFVDSKVETDEQRRRFAIYYVSSEVQRSYFSFEGAIDQRPEESEVLKAYPELGGRFDKDGLLPVDSEFVLHDGGIEYRDHILHYHQLLRRGYASNPNFDFLGRFMRYYQRSNASNTFRIAIDHRRIMPKEFYARIVECDTWYGPTFDTNKLDDPNYVGLTVVARNKNSLFEMTCSLDRTEFFWSHKNGVKTFQVEEIAGDSYTFDQYYFNRYVHSERDISTRAFRHLDGAVKVYLKDSFHKRKETFLPDEYRSYRKVKLWRIDGEVDLDDWIDLTSFFFKCNEMIVEYFNPKQFEQMFELRVRDFKEWKRRQTEPENCA